MIDALRFERAKANALGPAEDGIGTLGEKTVHAVLKAYYRAEGMQAEVPLGRHIADLWDGRSAIEIQTRSLGRLGPKLDAWLPHHPVRVVVPVPRHKWLVWLDPETAAMSQKRRSPKAGQPCHALTELYDLRGRLGHPNLSITLVMLDILEYRALGPQGKRGSRRYDRLPLELVREIELSGRHGWAQLIPEGLPAPFTSRDFSKAGGLSNRGRQVWKSLQALETMGAITRCGKQGNSILYGEK